MKFKFNEKKAAQAAAFVIARHGGSFNYMHLIKILYMSDRRSLLERGVPITGDRMVSMDQGPVLSMVLTLISHEQWQKESAWFDLIERKAKYDVGLKQNAQPLPPRDELSDYEVETLTQTDDVFGKMDKWDLVKYLHDNLPEWQDPNGSSIGIDPARILAKAGVPKHEIERLERAAAERLFLMSL